MLGGLDMTQSLRAAANRWIGKATIALMQVPTRMAQGLEGWRERHVLSREFAALRQNGEFERTLTDSGISSSEVARLFRAHPGAARQFGAMIERVGLDRARLPHIPRIGAELRDMEWRCGECGSWRQCRDWLATGLGSDGYRRFCPNADALEQLRDEQHGEPPQASPRPGILGELKACGGQIP
jgi:hypothetical protein